MVWKAPNGRELSIIPHGADLPPRREVLEFFRAVMGADERRVNRATAGKVASRWRSG